jgi:hypothetical protein
VIFYKIRVPLGFECGSYRGKGAGWGAVRDRSFLDGNVTAGMEGPRGFSADRWSDLRGLFQIADGTSRNIEPTRLDRRSAVEPVRRQMSDAPTQSCWPPAAFQARMEGGPHTFFRIVSRETSFFVKGTQISALSSQNQKPSGLNPKVLF